MQDLELEHAELLPSRETLCCHSGTAEQRQQRRTAQRQPVLSGISVFGNGVAQNGSGNSAIVF